MSYDPRTNFCSQRFVKNNVQRHITMDAAILEGHYIALDAGNKQIGIGQLRFDQSSSPFLMFVIIGVLICMLFFAIGYYVRENYKRNTDPFTLKKPKKGTMKVNTHGLTMGAGED